MQDETSGMHSEKKYHCSCQCSMRLVCAQFVINYIFKLQKSLIMKVTKDSLRDSPLVSALALTCVHTNSFLLINVTIKGNLS